ncbi:hypothetical protein SAMN05444422_101582 [Halobiforma haloterrestris]|uniref:Uncharacterized protein n=1 Tax=Natronobacterium haloterrestre TaxID=148448 RepID=A0A1I1DEV9_NATHA|nr:hypothetical protein SAMN05444422_101582 [Halobiforma haloterrestris]
MSADGLEIRDRIPARGRDLAYDHSKALQRARTVIDAILLRGQHGRNFRLGRGWGGLVVLFRLLENVVDDRIEVVEDGLYAVVLVAVVSLG